MPIPIDWFHAMESRAGSATPRDRDELHALFHSLAQWSHDHRGTELAPHVRDALRETYRVLGTSSRDRYQLLLCLAWAGGASDLSLLAELLVEDPPSDSSAMVAPLIPLLHVCRHPAALFPRLLDALGNPPLAAAVLDLANHLVRRNVLSGHPGADRVDVLIRLLDSLTSELERLQTVPLASPESPSQVGDSVAIVIALCDSLGLIGDRRATRVLEQVSELQHRRLRVEALAALGLLSHPEAVAQLAALAAEPSVRLRVLAYLDALGVLSQVEDVHQSPVAIAEAELVAYLAEPTQFGIPPTHCELLDHTTLMWPGYEEPRNCYLFAFTYRGQRGDATFSVRNIGLVGPVAMSFREDLTGLPPHDLYAIFAGWHAEHAEIMTVDWNASDERRAACDRLIAGLESREFGSVRPCLMNRFFGTDVLAAHATCQGRTGVAVTDAEMVRWFPDDEESRVISPERALDWYRGQRLLGLFNDDWDR